jgi:hypothetical protein
MAILSHKEKITRYKKNQLMKETKHYLNNDIVKKLMSLSSPMLCGSHFCPFPPISQVDQWPQAKPAATCQAKCKTRLLSAPTELE